MGCSSCGRRNRARIDQAFRRRYKYLTNAQIQQRLEDFKKKYCVQLLCEEVGVCSLDMYRKCKKRKEVIELM